MENFLLGVFFGYCLKDKIDPESKETKKTTNLSPASVETEKSNLMAGLEIAVYAVVIGLFTFWIGWFILAILCVGGLIVGISLMLTPNKTA